MSIHYLLLPLNFLRTGVYNSQSEGNIGARILGGYWWSRISGVDSQGYYLYVYPGVVGSQPRTYRGHDFAVRCVVREE